MTSEIRFRTKQFKIDDQVLIDLEILDNSDGFLSTWEANHLELPYWAEIWPPAIVLCKLLVDLAKRNLLQGKRILEIGSGTGIVGIVAALCGASSVMLTDCVPGCIELIKRNLKRNLLCDKASSREFQNYPTNTNFSPNHCHLFPSAIDVQLLNWKKPNIWPTNFDLILGSEILYDSSCVEPISALLGHLLLNDRNPENSQHSPTVLITDPGRGYLESFQRLLRQNNELSVFDHDPVYYQFEGNEFASFFLEITDRNRDNEKVFQNQIHKALLYGTPNITKLPAKANDANIYESVKLSSSQSIPPPPPPPPPPPLLLL